MTMGFEDILEFEELNDVQVNVFGNEDDKLLPFIILSHEF